MTMSEIERNENGVPINEEKNRAEMFLKEFLYRATDCENGEINMDKAINTLLKMREVNSFEFFGEYK